MLLAKDLSVMWLHGESDSASEDCLGFQVPDDRLLQEERERCENPMLYIIKCEELIKGGHTVPGLLGWECTGDRC